MARGDKIQGPQDRSADVAQLFRDFGRIREKVEKFTGERGDDKRPLSAVRRSEFKALASIGLQSGQVAAAPTQADFNALQKDVANIFQALQRISNVLGNADIPKV